MIFCNLSRQLHNPCRLCTCTYVCMSTCARNCCREFRSLLRISNSTSGRIYRDDNYRDVKGTKGILRRFTVGDGIWSVWVIRYLIPVERLVLLLIVKRRGNEWTRECKLLRNTCLIYTFVCWFFGNRLSGRFNKIVLDMFAGYVNFLWSHWTKVLTNEQKTINYRYAKCLVIE